MKRLFLLPIVVILLLSFVASACVPAAAPTPTPTKPAAPPPATPTPVAVATPTPLPPTATPTKPPAPVTIRLFGVAGEPLEPATKKIVAMFEEKHPNIKVAYETVPFGEFYRKIAVYLASGDPPDIIWPGGPFIVSYAYAGSIIPLGDIYTKEDMADFVETSVKQGTYEGKLYGAPWMQATLLIFYNTKMFDEAGIKPPRTLEDAWTWPQFAEALRKVVGPIPAGGVPKVWGLVTRSLGAFYDWLPLIRSNDKPGTPTYMGVSPDGSKASGYLDTPQALEAFQFMSDFFNKWQLSPQATVPNAFEDGKAATYLRPEDLYPILTAKYPNLPWSITPLPYLKTPITHTGHFMFTITAASKHQKEAKEFIKFATSKEIAATWQKLTNSLPARKSVLAQIPEYQTFPLNIPYQELIEWGQPPPVTPGFTAYGTMTAEALTNIIKGQPVDATIKTMVSRLDAELKKYAK
ncbi:MAG: extracellular solute-binding protein [Chloroflexi bacterium]|nr:extracellular solute-binding protein [Chloroflexota bacterium]MCL5074460.1 extracellular solute-binding protein [Chloroflexota bacterium]